MSKSRMSWSALAMALTVITTIAGSATAGVPGGPGGGAMPPMGRGRGGAGVPQGLEASMSEMNRMVQDLKRVAADPAQAEQALKDCATFERDVSICKLLVPPQINRMSGDAKTEALTSYRSMMTGLVKTALDLEDAINAKKPDDIKKSIAQLEEIEKQGHTELKVGKD